MVEGGEVDALRLRVGDCLAETAVDGSGEVESVPVVPCSEPHHTELYHSFQLAGDDFPVDPSVEQLAGEGCYDAFESFIGLAYEDSVWDISTIYPTPESWDQINDREVLCGTYRVDDGLSVGSAEGSAE